MIIGLITGVVIHLSSFDVGYVRWAMLVSPNLCGRHVGTLPALDPFEIHCRNPPRRPWLALMWDESSVLSAPTVNTISSSHMEAAQRCFGSSSCFRLRSRVFSSLEMHCVNRLMCIIIRLRSSSAFVYRNNQEQPSY